jgi:predicted transcriptional regulator
MAERDRRMALEGIRGDNSDPPEKQERALEILKEVLAEVKAGRVFNADEVLAEWKKDSEKLREAAKTNP